jgi:hypothetical protein
MRKNIFSGVLILLFLSILSCQKTDQTEQSSAVNLESTLKAAVSEITGNEVIETGTQDIHGICMEGYDGLGQGIRLNDGMMQGIGGQMKFKMPLMSECATISVSDASFPKEITIDYGTGCSDRHQHSIRGKIIINLSDSLINPGAIKTVFSEDLYIDSVKVELNSSHINFGKNASGNWLIYNTTNQVLTLEDGTIVKQVGRDTIEWLGGFETVDKSDDVFKKTGSGSTTIDDSLVYSRAITSPLLYDRSCEFIKSGIVELYKNGSSVIIDYGDGTCDSKATVTTDGTSEEINLHSKGFKEHGKFAKHCQKHYGGGH